MSKAEYVMKKFRENGYKITPQRIAIFKLLENKQIHLSADAIFKKIRSEHPSISLTTVYNTLDKLCEMGEVAEVNLNKERVLFDSNGKPHHHMICLNCMKVSDVANEHAASVVLPADIRGKFTVSKVCIQFLGYCGRCRRGVSA